MQYDNIFQVSNILSTKSNGNPRNEEKLTIMHEINIRDLAHHYRRKYFLRYFIIFQENQESTQERISIFNQQQINV